MKKINYLVWCIVIILFIEHIPFYNNEFVEGENNSVVGVEYGVLNYAEQHYKNIVEATIKFNNIEGIDIHDISLDDPFVIYDLDDEDIEEVYYFPIEHKEKIIYIMDVVCSDEGFSVSLSEEWVDELNDLDKELNQIIFCESDMNLCIKDRDDSVYLHGKKNDLIEDFVGNSYEYCKKVVRSKYDKKKSIHFTLDNNLNCKSEYSPKFSTNTDSSKICKLYNAKGQGNYGLCWAATVATIYNYRNGKNISAKNVANRMNIGYNSGATLGQQYLALDNYGLRYSLLNDNASDLMSWEEIKNNIRNKYPILVEADGKESDHTVTVYGYAIAASDKYVIYWNSANKKSITTLYKSSGTIFMTGNECFVWKWSISKM